MARDTATKRRFSNSMERHDYLCRVEMTELLESYGLRWVFNGQEHRSGHNAEVLKELREQAVMNEFSRNDPDLRVWSRHFPAARFLLDVKHSHEYESSISIPSKTLLHYAMQQTMQGLHMVLAGHTQTRGFRFFDLAYVQKNKRPGNFKDSRTGAPYEVIPITCKLSCSADEFLGSFDPLGLIRGS